MAAVSTRVLTHLDPQNRYSALDAKLYEQIYVRFTITEQCLIHVQEHVASSEKEVHFFLPDTEIEQIQQHVDELDNTRMYVYCSNEQSVSINNERYRQRASYKIFDANDLEFRLCSVQVELMGNLVSEAPSESPERYRLVAMTQGCIRQLKMSLKQHADAQLSREAT